MRYLMPFWADVKGVKDPGCVIYHGGIHIYRFLAKNMFSPGEVQKCPKSNVKSRFWMFQVVEELKVVGYLERTWEGIYKDSYCLERRTTFTIILWTFQLYTGKIILEVFQGVLGQCRECQVPGYVISRTRAPKKVSNKK